MEPEGALRRSQQPLCIFLSSARLIHCTLPNQISWWSILILLFYQRKGLLYGTFISGITTKTLYVALLSHIHATCPAHPILIYFIIE
jgi:hypothetical protein